MQRRLRKIVAITIAAMMVLTFGTILWLTPARLPPSVSIALLGYTNRVGPYALLAITNCSASAITLDSACMVRYSPPQDSAPHRATAIEANSFRMTRLLPTEGFVQEFFVFPASQGEWQFECAAAYSSAWLETRRAAENRLRKHFRRLRFPLTSKMWHRFETGWFTCPP